MLKSLVIALSLMSTVAMADQLTDCDENKQESSVVALAAARHLPLQVLTGGAIQAFNAQLVGSLNADPEKIPDMDQIDIVLINPEDDPDQRIDAVIAFSHGCLVGGMQLPASVVRVLLERSQAMAEV